MRNINNDSTLIGVSAVHPDYPHIYMLNGYTFSKKTSSLFKYMPLRRLVDSVNNQELIFVSPDAWYDPFEQIYYNIDCSSRGYVTEDIACMCLSNKSSTNEDASWRIYSDSTNKTVRVSFDREVLLSFLDNYAANNGFTVYIGKVNYSLDKNEIQNLLTSSSEYFPPKMKREHYLSLMLLKRKAFSYENEIRVFLVKNEIKFSDNLFSIECDYRANQLISNIVLSPYPPVRTQTDIAYKVRERMNKMESDEIKRRLSDLLDCKIKQSMLYKIYPRISRC